MWLWAVRVFKTRTLAATAIRDGKVTVDGEPAKAARALRGGERVVARVNQMTRTVRVLDAPKSRVGAKLVPQYLEDLTPPAEYQRRREANLLPPGFRPKGAGRPTKRQRRQMKRLDSGMD